MKLPLLGFKGGEPWEIAATPPFKANDAVIVLRWETAVMAAIRAAHVCVARVRLCSVTYRYVIL